MNPKSVFKFLLGAVRLPILSVVRLVLLVLLFFPILFARIWEKIWKYLHKRNLKEKEEPKDCHLPLPEEVMRRPDPCIYSQSYLHSQGLPVTWNNPDIWLAKASDPNTIEPDSYHLLEDTDYIVSVKTHNASTDPAIGVKVRLVYRPWSFNVPEELPVETDINGVEVAKIANIAPMGSTIVKFAWHTPIVDVEEKKHFCIQAMLSHPLDTNLGNNIGQENTDVLDVTPGQSARVVVPLFNALTKPQTFTVEAIHYAIDEQTVTLNLRKNIGRPRRKLSQKLGLAVPAINLGMPRGIERSFLGKVGLSWDLDKYILKTKYTGFEKTIDRIRLDDHTLPNGIQIEIENYNNGVELAPGAVTPLAVDVKVLDDAVPGLYPITLIAQDRNGQIVGGVTLLTRVQ